MVISFEPSRDGKTILQRQDGKPLVTFTLPEGKTMDEAPLNSVRWHSKSIRRLGRAGRETSELAAAICQCGVDGHCLSRRPHNLKINVLQLVQYRAGGVE
jgi:hypothetical protein